MKQTIEWHERVMVNRRAHAADEERNAVNARKRASRASAQLEFAERQLKEAKRRGMTAYDDDRLLVSRPWKTLARLSEGISDGC